MGCRQLNELALLYEQAKKSGLNTKLIMDQGLDTSEIKNLINLHKRLKNIFEDEEKLIKEYKENPSEEIKKHLLSLSDQVKEIEFELQKNWHFDQNEDYHSWWFRQPACSCPIIDNFERVGVPGFIINQECILHGKDK